MNMKETLTKGTKMITIKVTLHDGTTHHKACDPMGTPLSGMGCFVEDVAYGVFMRSEVKELNWKFI